MDNELRIILELIDTAIDDKCTFPSPVNNINWNKILYICKIHSITNLVYYAIEKLQLDIDENTKNEFKKEHTLAVIKETKQSYELSRLLKEFDKNSIDCVILKGTAIRKLYPSPDMRTMGDIDFLIRPEQMKAASDILISSGYEALHTDEEFKHDAHDEFIKKPYMMIELHRSLISKGRFEKIDSYYEDLWDKLSIVDNYSHIYEMNREEFYIFMMVHIMKHYKLAGTGIRSFIDVWVYLEKYSDTLDWEYINQSFKSMDILDFCENVKQMVYAWFGKCQYTDKIISMTKFIAYSGIYGNKKNEETLNIINNYEDITSGIIKRFLLKIFPSVSLMKKMYPILRKHIYLLPVCYVIRLIHRIIFKREHINEAVKDNLDKNYINKLKEHFTEIGL